MEQSKIILTRKRKKIHTTSIIPHEGGGGGGGGQRKTTTPWLLEEIVFFHILPRLSTKDLVRFCCVSKLWLNTIRQDPNFIASHLIHAKSRPLIALGGIEYGKFSFIYLDHDDDNQRIDVYKVPHTQFSMIGGCNGLICIRSFRIEICNPSTRELLAIPYPPRETREACVVNYGFGFDPVMNEYKVINIKVHEFVGDGTDTIRRAKVMVYTLGTNSWRDVALTSNLPNHLPIDGVPFHFNGVLYWFARQRKLMSFDIHYEKFGLIPCPESLPPCITCWSIIELRGSLCLAFVNRSPKDEIEINIYMQQGESSWVKETRIEIGIPSMEPTFPLHLQCVVAFSNQIFLQCIIEGKLALYNPHTRNHKKIVQIPKLIGHQCYYFQYFNQVENLISLKTLVPPGSTEVMYVSSSRDTSKRRPSKRHSKRLPPLKVTSKFA